MTKVTVLGQEPKEEKKLKPIEFKEQCNYNEWHHVQFKPKEFAYIELISKSFVDKNDINLDLMFAYDGRRSDGMLFLGHFNDGVVE